MSVTAVYVKKNDPKCESAAAAKVGGDFSMDVESPVEQLISRQSNGSGIAGQPSIQSREIQAKLNCERFNTISSLLASGFDDKCPGFECSPPGSKRLV